MKIIRPQKGFQEKFLRSRVDFAIGGGSAGSGKSFISSMLPSYFCDKPQFRAVFVRRNLGDLTAGGGLFDTILDIYPRHMFSRIAESGSPVFQFNSGAEITLTHFADESPSKFNERVRGWQYDLIYLDEMTSYEWSTIAAVMTRNRGSSGVTPMIRGTCNPKRNSWLRKWLDWYIGEDGFIREDRDGVVRYFYMMGKTVDDVVWGSSKQEVYQQCRVDIDRKISKLGDSDLITPESFIKSFVFYRGKLSENRIALQNNPNYISSLSVSGGAYSQQQLEGNWNVDEEDDESIELLKEDVDSVFHYDKPNKTGELAITADIALTGTDNMVMLVWDGFHIIDKEVILTTDAPNAIRAVKSLALRHNIPDSRIIFDGQAIGSFVGGNAGFIKNAVAFVPQSPSRGNPNYSDLKSQCADKVIAMIKRGLLTCSPAVANSVYQHQKIKTPMSFSDRVAQELRILRFEARADGFSSYRKRVIKKKRMVELLGSSPDIIDNLIMRMALDLDYTGEAKEIKKVLYTEDGMFNIYADSDEDDDILNYL